MALTEEEKKKKAQAEYAKKQEMLKSAKKSGTTAQPKKKPQDAGNVNAGKVKTETKTEEPKSYNYTSPAQKRTQQISESIADKTTPAKFSAKAISSEAEKYVPASQKRKQATSDQIYENVLKGEAYLQSEGDGLAKGLINRLRSAGGETIENVARVINDNVSPDSYFGRTSQNVIDRNTAGQIGDIADQQIMAAKENTGVFGDFLIDTADAGANMASQAILSGVLLPGAPAPVANKIFSGVQGVSTGAQKYVDTREAGGSKAEAWQRGLGSGAVAAATEGLTGIGKTGVSKIPGVNKVVTHLDEFATKNWLTNVLSTGLGEGGEEGLEYALEWASDVIADLIYKGEIEAEFNVAELFQNVASGFVLGAGFGTVNYNPDAKPVETDTVVEPSVSPAEAPIVEAENVTPETANEQEGAFANAARRIKQLQDDRYFVEVTLKNLEKQNPITAARDRVVWDEKLERINNEIESIIREVSPEALESNAQVNSANDVVESANAGEKVKAENQNKEEAGTLASVEDVENEIAKVEQEMQNLEKTTFAKNPRQSPSDFYDGQEWRNLKKKKRDLEEQRDFLDAISYRNKNLPFEKDENGRYIMYHGSPFDFNNFDANRMGGLINFAPEYQPASWYSAAGLRGALKNDVDRYVIDEDSETLYRRTAKDRDVWEPFARGKKSEDGMSVEILPFKDGGEKVALKTITSDDIENPDSDYRATSVSANVGKYAVKADNTLDLDDETRYKQNLALWKKIRDDAYKAAKDNKISANVFNQVDLIYSAARDEKTFRGFWSITKKEYASHAFKDFIVPELKKYGFDSIYHKDDGHKTLVVFEPEQASQIAKRYFWGNGEFVPTKANNTANAQVNSTDDAIEPTNDVIEPANAQLRAQGDGGFGTNTVGAAQSNPKSYSYAQNTYGTYPEGENATRIVDVPTSMDGERKINRFARTEMEAGATPDSLIPNFEKAVENGDFSYDVASDKGAMEYAKNKIVKEGFEKSVGAFEGLVDGEKVLSKKDLVLGEMLYAQAAQSGDAKTAMRLASALAQEFTKAGQAVQAARILKKLSPEGRLYNAQKIVDRFNDKNNKPKNQKDISIDEKLATDLLTAQTEEEIEAAEEAIKENIAEQLVSTKMDKWNAWRYLSMLGNPKTHIRNVMGNAMFVPARALKNGIKATLEKGYAAKHKNYERTTTIAKATDAQKNFAKESFEKNKNKLLSGGNYRFESDIESKKKVFDNKALEWARNKNSELLEKEDIVFLKRAYVDSLAKYLRANNIDPQKADAKQIAKAEGYAEQEAKKATYRDESEVAQSIERLSRTNGVTRVLSDALLPFRKTPINILARGVEYSPVELAKALTYDMAKVKKGEMEPQKMLDHIASGLTGTGVVALGALLAHLDLISGGDNEDDKAQNFGELQGEQNYAFKIGDYSYTLDWATPISMPLFVGVEAYNALKGEGFDSGDVFNATLNAISKTADPMIGLSMLQNVEKLLSGNYGGEGSGLGNVIKEATISYVLQAFPTLGTQIAQTIDPKQRNAYYTDKTNEIPDILEIPLNRVLAKIPLASQLLPERVDEWGRTEKQEENIALRIFENFASPGYISKNKSTEVDEMLKQLYKDTGNASVLPSNMQKYVTVGGNKKDLSAQEYVDAQKKAGSTKYDMLNQLIKDNDFKKLSAERKASIVSDVYSYGTVKGKQEVSNYVPTEKWYKNIEEAKKEGVSAPDYLVAKNFYNNIETKEGGRSKNLQMLDQLIADKGNNEKQDVALLEYVAGVDMKKYKSATTEPSEMLELYEVVSNGDKKEVDIKNLHQKGYSKAEALAKYNVADGTKKYENGEFKFGNSTKQKAKAERLAKKGYSPEEIVKAANAVTSIGKYGTSKSYSTCIKMLKAVGITDKKFQNDFYNIYFG